MNGYKGKVHFYKYIGSSHLVFCGIPLHSETDFVPPENAVIIGSCDVDVEFETDARQAEVEALEKEVSRKNAEHQQWLNMMNGKIQSLLAIDHEVPQ